MSLGKPVAGVCVSTALFVCGAAGFPAAPAELPPASGVLVLDESSSSSPVSLAAGDRFTIRGDGFADGASVTLTLYSTPRDLGHVVADTAGAIDTTVALPTDVTGVHTVSAIGNGADGTPRSLQAPVHILAQTDAPPVTRANDGGMPRSLAYTGASVAGMLIGAAGLMVAGFALVRTAVFRRRLVAAR